MAEWSNAVDSKSIVLFTGTGSSNLPLSANEKAPFRVLFLLAKNKTGFELPKKGRREGYFKSDPFFYLYLNLSVLPLSFERAAASSTV